MTYNNIFKKLQHHIINWEDQYGNYQLWSFIDWNSKRQVYILERFDNPRVFTEISYKDAKQWFENNPSEFSV
jgi:hypothetical protein